MGKTLFDWAGLGGIRFQELCAALFRQEGYEVEDQGSGADGGIDLLVTEHVSLGIGQDRKHVWAVQAKYKENPDHSVRSSDLGNIANLIGRFRADGFLLITNARVANKTYLEIRAIESTELHRTAQVWERGQLEAKLLQHSQLRQQFFASMVRPSVLLVDDQLDVLRNWQTILTSLDVEIDIACNAELALSAARRRPPKVALLDIMLASDNPVKDGGFQLAAELRVIAPEIKIVYLSAYIANREVALRAAAENAVFLSKFDVDAPRLRQAMSDMLGTPVEIATRAQQFGTMSTFVNRKLHQIVGKVATTRMLGQAQGAVALPRILTELNEALGALKAVMHDLALERFTGTSSQVGEVNIVAVLDRAVTGSRRLHADAQIELDVPDEEILLRGDTEALEAALGDLLDNALEASGTKTWALTRAELRIVKRERDYARISISDKGTGISPEILAKMYVPGNTTKSGTGMGFYLATKIVEFHGGWIQVESPAKDWPTTVSVQIPIETIRQKVVKQSGH